MKNTALNNPDDDLYDLLDRIAAIVFPQRGTGPPEKIVLEDRARKFCDVLNEHLHHDFAGREPLRAFVFVEFKPLKKVDKS